MRRNRNMRRDRTYQRYLCWVLSLSLSLIFTHVGILLTLDPLHLFHRTWFGESYYIRELRFQAAGIINSVDFDSIILGSSIAANFSPEEASREWDSKFVNLSPDGSLLSERSILLGYALKKKALKNVVLSLDGFAGHGQYSEHFPVSNFDFLYNNDRLDDLQLYSNAKYLSYALCGYVQYLDDFCKRRRTLQTVSEWASDQEQSKRFGGLSQWLKYKNEPQVRDVLNDISSKFERLESDELGESNSESIELIRHDEMLSFEDYVLRYIQEYPETDFYLFFPPYARLKQSFSKKIDPSGYELYLDRIRYVVRLTHDYQNVRIYGFDDLEFTSDIANYKDPVHYHQRYNSLMLKWMHDSRYKLTADNVEQYIETISVLHDNYDVYTLGKAVKCSLKREKDCKKRYSSSF